MSSTETLSTSDTIHEIVFCIGIILPAAIAMVYLYYRWAQREAFHRSERDEMTRQFRLLIAVICVGAIMAVLNSPILGLLISLLFLWLAIRVAKYRVTIIPPRGRAAFVGTETLWTVPFYFLLAVFAALYGITPFFPPH